jgi:cold shock CspA family protein
MRGFLDCWKAAGYGFAYCHESKTRYFIHISNIKDGVVPQTGNLVEFDPGLTLRGPIGINVRVLNKAETIAAMLDAGSKS